MAMNEEEEGKIDWWVVFPILMICLFIGSIVIHISTDESECTSIQKTLMAVNGITDEDTGLFSRGDTEITSLLFDD